ncbi:PhzF family phenazine biosynthesis protein [Pseudonocardia sp. CA-142604]|uniref:PhzF family phenazine biosynthesis protein n=1 Tax=Pseudonocardia sp. CA-142604 TaxID=3240024 RepID=UPI003D8C5F52
MDVFAETAFRGNPAGVVLLAGAADAGWMQSVAGELNQTATAFVDVSGAEDAPKPLRWFSPTTELALCGHGTLASAHVLGGDQRFETRSGTLSCSAGSDGSVEIELPADPTRPEVPSEELVAGLAGVTVRSTWRGRHDVLVEAGSAGEVRSLRPDLAMLARVSARGVVVTAPGDNGRSDVVSRFFAPNAGIPEDPVTGSAHCTLASWWCPRLGVGEFLAEQASERGGMLRVRLDGDQVRLTGHAVTIFSGRLHTPTHP